MAEILRTFDRGILRVTLNRPERRNALSRSALRELRGVFEAHAREPELRIGVIDGAGLAFCAGGDLRDLVDTKTQEAAEAFAAEGTAALDAIRLFPVPTLAALNGVALGGGAEIAVACDMRLGGPHTRIGFVHALHNISTGWGGGADLTRLVGYGRAMELLAGARVLSAEEAVAIGLINSVAAEMESFVEFVEGFVAPMRDRPPHVMRALKAQALAERFGRPPLDRREGDAARFVESWIHPAHWVAAENALK
ncbi:MAG: enoyl-CoA hydratase/isomerase family protein [Burkholderiales bacterium]